MGKLVGSLNSGIGLGIEAATEYQSPNKGVGKRTNSNYQQVLAYGSRDIYHDEHQPQRDAKAFQELQSYADFQRVLSNKVQGDIYKDENKYTPIDPQIFQSQTFGDYFSHQPYVHPSLQQPSYRGRLQYPVMIPQRRPEDKSRGWVRAYAPALMDCGIDQYTFLNFLDAFHESSKASPYFDAVNIAGLGIDFAPGITPVIIAMAVPVAVKMARAKQTAKKSTDFLARANNELFAPHGLFAMVMTYKPTTASQTYAADISQPSQGSPFSPNSPELPTSAPLIFPEPETTGSAGQRNKFKQIGNFISEHGDRRAQARYAFETPDSTLATPPPTFCSRWGDPNNPTNAGGLASLISGGSRDRDEKRKEKRSRKSSASSESPFQEGVRKKPSLMDSFRGMGMNKDMLYLLIVNSSDSSPPSINPAPLLTPREHPSYPYREAKRIKSLPRVLEPDPFQQPWTPDAGVGWLPSERYSQPVVYESAPESRRQSPPPAYSSPRQSKMARYDGVEGREEREYCVPTL